MKLAAALIATSLLWAGCSTADPSKPVAIEPGQDFSLRAGQSAQTADGALRIGFEGVTVDSRCPKNAQCVWAGDAVVRVWLQQGAGARELRELNTAPGPAQVVRVRDQALRLRRLDPYPVVGKAVAAQDYQVTLALSPASDADPDR